jgi:hypothetical protein
MLAKIGERNLKEGYKQHEGKRGIVVASKTIVSGAIRAKLLRRLNQSARHLACFE